jgi:hypothetical protein
MQLLSALDQMTAGFWLAVQVAAAIVLCGIGAHAAMRVIARLRRDPSHLPASRRPIS